MSKEAQTPLQRLNKNIQTLKQIGGAPGNMERLFAGFVNEFFMEMNCETAVQAIQLQTAEGQKRFPIPEHPLAGGKEQEMTRDNEGNLVPKTKESFPDPFGYVGGIAHVLVANIESFQGFELVELATQE